MAELKRALELARSGHGQIVAAVAEAGTGKSRLVYEFKAALPGYKVLEAYSVSTGKVAAYQPVLELLHNYFGIETARLTALDPALGDIPIRRRRTLDALKRIVLRESLDRPLVVIFEDLHWIDTQTQVLLELLADSVANARVLLLVNYRPEYRHLGREELLHSAWAESARPGERRRTARGAARQCGRTGTAQAARSRQERRQSVLHRGAGAEVFR
jgi:predicted ATPase